MEEVFEGDADLVELIVGPPVPAEHSFQPLTGVNLPDKKRSYLWNRCHFNIAGYNGEDAGSGKRRENLKKGCHGEGQDGPYAGYYTLSWAIAVHGAWEYEPHKYVWINQIPDCKKWGPNQPAKINCKPGKSAIGQVFEKELTVFGDYRWQPGKYNGPQAPGSAFCLRVIGVLPARWIPDFGGSKIMYGNYSVYAGPVDVDDKCEFWDLPRILNGSAG